ncbi:MAG TPA: bifunctional metallophosphatase/5'-nucleotidase [Chitinophagaceae bacterium]|nr:bifunctional metallophosphatase/5'-nucleotidase [Chitinophagaceae bacterium]
MKNCIRLLIVFAIAAASCKTQRVQHVISDDGKIEIDFVQVNDVYEIDALDNGKIGGMARVATLKKQWLQKNTNTLLVMAGDFVSPSVYNSLKYNDTAIRGRQMIDAMNAADFDIAVFGNHEFDISESDLQRRINESNFKWVASNTFHNTGSGIVPFVKTGAEKFPEVYFKTFTDKDGTTAKIGFIGLTIPFNAANYVYYTDPLCTATVLYNLIKDSCDAVVAITHQLVDADMQLAQQLPGLAVILGGHEHDMRFEKVGSVYITKAHANAKSAYIVKLAINKTNKTFSVEKPELKYLDSTVAFDSAANAVVKKWVNIANANYSSLGFDATQVLIQNGDSLEGRETYIRSESTNLSQLVVHAMEAACPKADAAIINAGSIRVDDILNPPVTQYDILRTLPFGGAIREVEMKGSLLTQVLDTGRNNKANGGFLQYSSAISYENNVWSINHAAIDANKIYHIAIGDFLITGKEYHLDFLKADNPGIVKIYDAATDISDPRTDIRTAIVQYLQKRKGKL